jgi:hypothetical protein
MHSRVFMSVCLCVCARARLRVLRACARVLACACACRVYQCTRYTWLTPEGQVHKDEETGAPTVIAFGAGDVTDNRYLILKGSSVEYR